jgi:hypothetical protein
MITAYNALNYAQTWYLEKAFLYLKNKGLITESEHDKFVGSLEGYFAHMGDLINTDPNFALIPSDENPCVINANDRTITLPKAFSTCGGVVGDTMCEIVTFTIDRYYDYVDLATTNICVQWSTPGPEKKEGISHISLIDLETEPGKIRFGWPLTSEVTAAAGNVEFAVRFFAEKKGTKELVYILNTVPAKLPIKAGLNVKSDATIINAASLFETFVENSMNPSFAIPSPVVFTTGDLPGLEKLAEDKLTLASYADVADNGHIDYVWYFKEGATADTADEIAAIMIEGTSDDRYEQKIAYEEILPMPTERVGKTQYYVYADGQEPPYNIWTEKELPEQKYFRRITTLRFKTRQEIGDEDLSKRIAGLYWVGARNYTGSDIITNEVEVTDKDGNKHTIQVAVPAYNKTPEVSSTRCYLPLPAKIEIEALPTDVFLKDGKAVLEMKVNEDGGNPNRSYSWYHSDESEVVEGDKLSTEAAVLNVVTPGWYHGSVKSELNRAEESGTSSVCRVLAPITAPELGLSYEQNGSIVNYETTGEDIGIVQNAGEDIKLIITPSFDASNRLLSDELTYTWYVTEADLARREIVASDVGDYGFVAPANGDVINSNTLVVQKLSNTALAFDCEVKNTLANQTVIAKQSVPFIVK